MQSKGDRVRLLHMREAATKIERFTAKKSRRSLDDDELLYNALTWLFHVVGEAANHVSMSFQQDHPDIAWSDIIGFRNRIVHGYDNIDKDIMWSIIEHDLPLILASLRTLDLSSDF
jgi:uncharacterized protein with HEPN domain